MVVFLLINIRYKQLNNVCFSELWKSSAFVFFLRYPGKVVLLTDLPPDVSAGLRKDDGKSLIVQFYGDLDYASVDEKKVTELGQSKQDLRWSRFPGI